jgi:hypothetical protein
MLFDLGKCIFREILGALDFGWLGLEGMHNQGKDGEGMQRGFLGALDLGWSRLE